MGARGLRLGRGCLHPFTHPSEPGDSRVEQLEGAWGVRDLNKKEREAKDAKPPFAQRSYGLPQHLREEPISLRPCTSNLKQIYLRGLVRSGLSSPGGPQWRRALSRDTALTTALKQVGRRPFCLLNVRDTRSSGLRWHLAMKPVVRVQRTAKPGATARRPANAACEFSGKQWRSDRIRWARSGTGCCPSSRLSAECPSERWMGGCKASLSPKNRPKWRP